VKKSILIILSIIAILPYNFAQKIEYRASTGLNFSFISDFANSVVVNEGLIVPNLYSINNTDNYLGVSRTLTNPQAKMGFFADFEMRFRFAKKWKISFGLGLNQVKFSYDTKIDLEGEEPYYLSEVIDDYAEMNIYYLNLQLANASAYLLNNKLILQGGSLVNILLKSNSHYYSIQYKENTGNSPTDNDINRIYFETEFANGIPSLVLGAQFKIEYQLLLHFYSFVSGNMYFSSLYGHSDSVIKANQLRLGVSYRF